MRKKLFGTDGIRGVVGQYPLTEDIVLRLGMAIGESVRENGMKNVVIGKDTRSSCQMLQKLLVYGILSKGQEVIDVGVVPTPAVAVLTKRFHAAMGVMISASHNQVEDNGIKLFSENGYKVSDTVENRIEEFIFSDFNNFVVADLGRLNLNKHNDVLQKEDSLETYLSFVKGILEKRLNLEGMKTVIDCANGSVSGIVSPLFESLGLEVITINDEPDGSNINLNCGSSVPSVVREEVLRHRADIGISFDGDGDRVVMVDNSGEILDGDHLMAIIGTDLIRRNKLAENTVVATVMSNLGLDEAIGKYKGKVLRSEVGDKHVMKKLLDNGLIFGGEPSGHIVFLDYNTTADALITSIKLLEIISKSGRTLKELSTCIEKYPQVLINVPVKVNTIPVHDSPEILNAIDESKNRLGEISNILIRYSGTEPVVRVMVEGRNMVDVEREALKLSGVVREVLG
ncbi:MAG: phosphoglucosamine mutase [Candidatus Omnitrophica bacterium]|nr:phosphoglucosamine mutase [Candidatus Omnitrophota bacterium]